MPGQAIPAPEHPRPPIELRQRGNRSVGELGPERRQIAHRQRGHAPRAEFVAHSADVVEDVAEREAEAAVTSRKAKEQEDDDRNRLRHQQHGHSRGLPKRAWRTTAMKPNERGDRKSTRLNSSHGYISYAVFCLK